MKIRTRVVIAFLAFSFAPLTGIVLFTYFSSLRALRGVEASIAQSMTEEMKTRLASITENVSQRVNSVSRIAFAPGVADEKVVAGIDASTKARVLEALGDVAPLVQSFEFIPAVPEALEPPMHPGVATAPDTPGRHSGAVVIDIARILSEVEELRSDAVAAQEAIVAGQVAKGEQPQTPGSDIDSAAAVKLDAEARVARRRAMEYQVEVSSREIEQKSAEARERAIRSMMVDGQLELPLTGSDAGTLRAEIRAGEIVQQVVSRGIRAEGEIPFAVDSEGSLHTATETDRVQLADIGVVSGEPAGTASHANWVVVSKHDPDSGLTLGMARPIGDSILRMRKTAARNFAWGLGLIGLALLGIVPIANHTTKEIELVTDGAHRIASGDLSVRLPVRSKSEIGQLAKAFNSMAEDLVEHRERLVDQERQRRENELDQRLLAADYARKSDELEEARRFQLSLLPRTVPEYPGLEISAFMRTATEVGGDYYDFHVGSDDALTLVVGDATGHGAKSATMVTIVKSLFAAWDGSGDLRTFLGQADTAIRRMDLGRMAMAMCLARFERDSMTVASAGMPPALVWRHTRRVVEEITLEGMPIGTLSGEYQMSRVELGSGDSVLFMSDGFPELLDCNGEPLGYPGTQEIFAASADGTSGEILSALSAAVDSWSGDQAPNDDVTFVVLKVM